MIEESRKSIECHRNLLERQAETQARDDAGRSPLPLAPSDAGQIWRRRAAPVGLFLRFFLR
jgi:hypothetical protein